MTGDKQLQGNTKNNLHKNQCLRMNNSKHCGATIRTYSLLEAPKIEDTRNNCVLLTYQDDFVIVNFRLSVSVSSECCYVVLCSFNPYPVPL